MATSTARFGRFALLVRDTAPGMTAGRWAVLRIGEDRDAMVARFRAVSPFCAANRIGLAVVGLDGVAAKLLGSVPAGARIDSQCPGLTPSQVADFERRFAHWTPGTAERRPGRMARIWAKVGSAARLALGFGGGLVLVAAVVILVRRDAPPSPPVLLDHVSIERPTGTDWYIRSGDRYHHYRTAPGAEAVYLGEVDRPGGGGKVDRRSWTASGG